MTFVKEEISESVGKIFYVEGTFLADHKSDYIGDTHFINKVACIFTKP